MSRNGPWIITAHKKEVCFTDVRPEDIHFNDIARALARIPRWNGHTPKHYSVAQHCVVACLGVPNEVKPHMLMHDAHEAYLGDISKPLKMLLPEIKELEARFDEVIFKKYKIQRFDSIVKQMDARMLATEGREFFEVDVRTAWGIDANSWAERIYPWDAASAEDAFIRTGIQLGLI